MDIKKRTMSEVAGLDIAPGRPFRRAAGSGLGMGQKLDWGILREAWNIGSLNPDTDEFEPYDTRSALDMQKFWDWIEWRYHNQLSDDEKEKFRQWARSGWNEAALK